MASDDLNDRQLELIAKLAALEPTLAFMGGYARRLRLVRRDRDAGAPASGWQRARRRTPLALLDWTTRRRLRRCSSRCRNARERRSDQTGEYLGLK
jgi:hypothetical protein